MSTPEAREIDFELVYEGQGALRPRDGERIAGDDAVLVEIFNDATRFLRENGRPGLDLRELCFEAGKKEILPTRNMQLGTVVTAEAAELKFTKAHPGIIKKRRVGNSIGEYAGFRSVGVLSFEHEVLIVDLRGTYMAEEAAKLEGTPQEGSVAVVQELSAEEAIEVVENVNQDNDTYAEVAGENNPRQITVSGTLTELALVKAAIESAGGKFDQLRVSVPVHSRLLKNVEKRMTTAIGDGHEFNNPPKDTVVLNRTGEYAVSGQQIANLAPSQTTNTVLLRSSMELVLGQRVGVNETSEQASIREARRHIIATMGPGRVMSGINKHFESGNPDKTRVLVITFDEAMLFGADWAAIIDSRHEEQAA